jgi:hypothetical protein
VRIQRNPLLLQCHVYKFNVIHMNSPSINKASKFWILYINRYRAAEPDQS